MGHSNDSCGRCAGALKAKYPSALACTTGLVLAGMSIPSLQAATDNAVWTNASADNLWSTAGNWSPAAVPNNGTNGFSDYNVSIGAPTPCVLNFSPSIDNLTINTGTVLDIYSSASLSVIGSSLVDNGSIVVNSNTGGAVACLNLSGGIISGTGTINLQQAGAGAQLNGPLTQSVGHSVVGFGQINSTFNNAGLVNANVGGQTLSINGISFGSGNFQASNGATLNFAGITTIGPGGSLIGSGNNSSLVISYGGALLIDGNITGAPAVTNSGTLTLVANPNSGILTRTLSTLSIGSTGATTILPTTNTANRTLLVLSSLKFAGNTDNWSGILNLTTNDLDISGGDVATISNQLKSGFSNGGWNGSGGITSSVASVDTTHLTAIGCIQNNQSGAALFTASHLFDGITPGIADTLVKYTSFGDANLDGKVDGSDYSRIDNGLLTHAIGWYNGDFNYDGVINGSDYTLIDNAFNRQTAVNNSQLAAATTQIGDSVVPEPASVTTALIAALSLLGRRKR